jgi:hypothetical protein
VKTSQDKGNKVSINTLLQSIKSLTAKELFTLEMVTIFLKHDKNFQEALPEINRRAMIQKPFPEIKEFIFPTFVLPSRRSHD